MAKKYLLASDFDRTLAHNGVVAPNVLEAIERFRAAGHLFGVVTGRDYHFSYGVFSKKNLFPFDFLVMATGGEACDEGGRVIFKSEIENAILPSGECLTYMAIQRILELSATPCGISLATSRLDFHPELPEGGIASDREYAPHAVAREISGFVHMNARCKSVEEAGRVTEILKNEFSEWIEPTQNGTAIDIPRRGITKSVGVRRISEHFSVDPDNVFTAGDNYNDITMLKDFHGFAMRAGTEAAIAAAESSADDIAEVIDMIMTR